MKVRLLLVLFAVLFFACGDDEEVTLDNPKISFHFKHYYKNQPLEVRTDNNLIYTNEMGNPWNVKSIKYFISKLIVYKDDGLAYDVNMYKLINPAETNTSYQEYVLNNIPEGHYNRVSFIFGIDSSRNKLLGLGNNSEVNSMEWPDPLGGGYHFMMMDGVFKRNDSVLSGYGIHLGKNGNQYKAEFPIDFHAEKGANANINILVNLDQWFDGINKINLNDGYGYIMESNEKQLLFKQNASRVFSLVQL